MNDEEHFNGVCVCFNCDNRAEDLKSSNFFFPEVYKHRLLMLLQLPHFINADRRKKTGECVVERRGLLQLEPAQEVTHARAHTHTVALHARLCITYSTPDYVSPIPRIHSLLRVRRTAQRKVVCTHVDTYTCVEEGCHYEEEGHVLHSGGTHT